jgi:hypothetical protein
MYAGEIGHTFILFSDEDWYHLHGYVNSQNNRYLCAENPMLVYRVPLHDVEVYVWCVVIATRITVPIISGTVNTHGHVPGILMPFLKTCVIMGEPTPIFIKTLQQLM